MKKSEIGAVILAGGLATRMGGGDKGLKEIQGKPIINRVIDTIAPQVGPFIMNANGDLSRFDGLGMTVVSDSLAGHLGPLAGILSAMQWMREHEPGLGWLLSVPTDTPFLPDDLVARLSAAIEAQNLDICMAASGGYDHPVIAMWSLELMEDLHQALVVDEIRKMKKWTSRHKCASVEWESDKIDPFFNANSPQDIETINLL